MERYRLGRCPSTGSMSASEIGRSSPQTRWRWCWSGSPSTRPSTQSWASYWTREPTVAPLVSSAGKPVRGSGGHSVAHAINRKASVRGMSKSGGRRLWHAAQGRGSGPGRGHVCAHGVRDHNRTGPTCPVPARFRPFAYRKQAQGQRHGPHWAGEKRHGRAGVGATYRARLAASTASASTLT
eukprot:scaffold527_cov368-Prasinococcus_capsulatus_cf.AAC.29